MSSFPVACREDGWKGDLWETWIISLLEAISYWYSFSRVYQNYWTSHYFIRVHQSHPRIYRGWFIRSTSLLCSRMTSETLGSIESISSGILSFVYIYYLTEGLCNGQCSVLSLKVALCLAWKYVWFLWLSSSYGSILVTRRASVCTHRFAFWRHNYFNDKTTLFHQSWMSVATLQSPDCSEVFRDGRPTRTSVERVFICSTESRAGLRIFQNYASGEAGKIPFWRNWEKFEAFLNEPWVTVWLAKEQMHENFSVNTRKLRKTERSISCKSQL